MQLLRDDDIDPAPLAGKRVVVVGYGNQGRAQALNLRDGGIDVRVALRAGSPTEAKVAGDGMTSVPLAALDDADIVMMLAPDEHLAAIYDGIEARLRPGTAIGFAHGLAIHYRLITPRADLDVFMVAPKGPGATLRSAYEAGHGMVGLFAVAQESKTHASGGTRDLALAYGRAIGCGRAGLMETSFADECDADLFNEGAVIWGAVPQLMLAGFDTLVEAGIAPELAWFECVSELKLLADLVAVRGIAGMREAISTTAEFGALSGARIVTDGTRSEMRRVLADIRSGRTVAEMMADAAAGSPKLRAARVAARSHPSEAIGAALRS